MSLLTIKLAADLTAVAYWCFPTSPTSSPQTTQSWFMATFRNLSSHHAKLSPTPPCI
jgi:hypothetical protein